MVDNVIYETGPPSRGPRPTRSYRLRHRPVPHIPPRPPLPPLDRQAGDMSGGIRGTRCQEGTEGPLWDPPSQEGGGGGGGGSGGPVGASAKEKAVSPGPSPPISPYGDIFLGNNLHNVPPEGPAAERSPEKSFPPVAKKKQKRLRKRSDKRKGGRGKEGGRPASPGGPGSPDPGGPADPYSTVEDCAPDWRASAQNAFTAATDAMPPGPDGPDPDADISPYACFYGAPQTPVVRAGWLDKLSPHGNYVFQRRWVRFDGESLAYYNNDKVSVRKTFTIQKPLRFAFEPQFFFDLLNYSVN
ncbi:arf-GAP with Rho-GAP domain, ANK repeat and PH domain-containing protein 2 [Gadus chalcogrammus]|uniref:arf-GAP with Rho-GAP domain, ANK repeat and PH domain-containing protein 2 n=1 Tax=Gadus chalcogrammus TaxID=1042646 RepID=UPI0024C4AE22|nr:arf-GAP with Rho-GAP domain, ANK repeat and PH domain-containing protein 2 [Gadus chalcogrammus]